MSIFNRFKINRKRFTPTPNNGTLTDTTWTSGHFGNGLNFNGTTSVAVVGTNSSILVNGKTQFSLEAWVYVDSTGSGNRVIIGNDNGSAGYYLRVTSAGKVEFYVQHATTDLQYITTVSITTDAWVLIDAVYVLDKTAKIYFNGVEQTYSTNTQGVGAISDDTGLNVNIGRRGGGSNDMYFKGNLDEVKFYNITLSSTQISANYSTPINPTVANLISWWRFSEGTGTTTEDGDIEYYGTNIYECGVNSTTGDYNSSSTFNITIENKDGILADSFDISNDISIYAEKDVNPPTTILLVGRISDLQFEGEPNREKLVITGRDYTSALQDFTVEPEVYDNQEVSVIVKDIISKYTQGITTTNVQVTGTTLPRIVYLQNNVYDAVKQLAEFADFYFYVDTNKDLHFEQRATVDSGLTFDSTNVTKSEFNETDDQLWNKIYVYGDRILAGHQDIINNDAGGGSVYTLTYKPHNTDIIISGTSHYSGGILQMSEPESNKWQYLVDFENRNIVFTSGTLAGDNIPQIGGSFIINYYRDVPIVKQASDTISQQLYGIRTKLLINKDIKDPRQAVDVANNQLDLYSMPIMQGNLELYNVFGITPGQLATINMPFENINSTKYVMIKASYEFNPTNNFANKVLKVTLSAKRRTLLDTLKQIILDLRKIQAADMTTSDIITRMMTSTGSVGIRVSGWTITTRNIGHSFILNHPVNGRLGSGYLAVDGSQIGLGDFREAAVIVASGQEIK